ncbi:hypothetical protein NL676_021889 [Syzygium grande]|nr:hypothetical protein NL676_021889 [Syzygium grande]
MLDLENILAAPGLPEPWEADSREPSDEMALPRTPPDPAMCELGFHVPSAPPDPVMHELGFHVPSARNTCSSTKPKGRNIAYAKCQVF